MAVARKRPKMRRMQISLSDEQWERARRLAARSGTSVAQVFREGLEYVEKAMGDEDRDYFSRMWSIVGMVKGADPNASVNHDDIIYGPNEAVGE